jgi:hypothetical protein
MSKVRPEILAFMHAAQALLAKDSDMPLSEEEMNVMLTYVAELNKLLEVGDGPQGNDFPDGHA